MPRPAVFVDRDGTLNEMVYDATHGIFDSPRRPEQVRLRPGAAEFLHRLQQAGWPVVIITNQPGLARGTLTDEDLSHVHQRLAELLVPDRTPWIAVYVCPHDPATQPCACRKPLPGLLLQAAHELDLDLTHSWMVGDGIVDIQAGRAAGCRTILVTRLKIEQVECFFSLENARPDFVVESLAQAAEIILRKENAR